jgi:proline dehydrogenase
MAMTAGTELSAALHKCHLLRARGFASALGFWHSVEHESSDVAAEFSTALRALEGSSLDCYLSIKPLGLAFRRDLLMETVDGARSRGVPLHFDSPSAELADITFSTIDEALSRGGDFGCTLPGRWRRSLADADWALERGLAIRVVKGQWADPDDAMRDPRAGFLAVIDRIAGRARRVGVATHDMLLAQSAIERLRAAGTPCELELLVGQPAGQALQMARRTDIRVRGYVVYGDGPPVYGPDATPPARARRASSLLPSPRSGGRARASASAGDRSPRGYVLAPSRGRIGAGAPLVLAR